MKNWNKWEQDTMSYLITERCSQGAHKSAILSEGDFASRCMWQHLETFFSLFFFKSHTVACGSSQAKGQTGAAVASLDHSQTTQDPSFICNLHHSSQQRLILNPLSEARDRTCVLMDTSQFHYCWATVETPWRHFWLSHLGRRRCQRHLVGGGQGCS